MPPPVQYAKSGDLFIAYQVTGDGPVDLIWSPGATSHLQLQWENPYFAEVHTGEVEVVGSAIRGIAVHTAARIASLAGPGDVYTSNTVRDLVAGSGLNFQDRGVHVLKGIPEPRQVLTVA